MYQNDKFRYCHGEGIPSRRYYQEEHRRYPNLKLLTRKNDKKIKHQIRNKILRINHAY